MLAALRVSLSVRQHPGCPSGANPADANATAERFAPLNNWGNRSRWRYEIFPPSLATSALARLAAAERKLVAAGLCGGDSTGAGISLLQLVASNLSTPDPLLDDPDEQIAEKAEVEFNVKLWSLLGLAPVSAAGYDGDNDHEDVASGSGAHNDPFGARGSERAASSVSAAGRRLRAHVVAFAREAWQLGAASPPSAALVPIPTPAAHLRASDREPYAPTVSGDKFAAARRIECFLSDSGARVHSRRDTGHFRSRFGAWLDALLSDPPRPVIADPPVSVSESEASAGPDADGGCFAALPAPREAFAGSFAALPTLSRLPAPAQAPARLPSASDAEARPWRMSSNSTHDPDPVLLAAVRRALLAHVGLPCAASLRAACGWPQSTRTEAWLDSHWSNPPSADPTIALTPPPFASLLLLLGAPAGCAPRRAARGGGRSEQGSADSTKSENRSSGEGERDGVARAGPEGRAGRRALVAEACACLLGAPSLVDLAAWADWEVC